MKKPLVIALLVLAAIGAGWFGWNGRDARQAKDELTLYGNVDIRQIALAFDASGRIAELRAEEGDQVNAGSVIGVLDTRTLELQAKQAEANVEAQRQTLRRLRNGSRPEEIAEVRARMGSAESDVQRAKRELSRVIRLQDSQAVSVQDVEQARNVSEVAKAKVEEVRATLRLAELGPRSEEVAVAEAQLSATEAQVALLRHQVDLGTLRAPTDAVVRSRLLEPGDMATPQKAVFSLALTKPKWIRVYINEPDLGKIQPGMQAQVFTDSHPDRPIRGSVGYISSVAEFTPKAVQTEELRTNLVYEVRVIVEDDANVLRLGQPATVHLSISAAP
ncbi:MAG: HlyD family efflux transporter periplasmic adaptor subunit [Nitrospira sp.]|nr:HlyD family efflux transporter periplasmic adaptor subunit [Nitrospira sp.]